MVAPPIRNRLTVQRFSPRTCLLFCGLSGKRPGQVETLEDRLGSTRPATDHMPRQQLDKIHTLDTTVLRAVLRLLIPHKQEQLPLPLPHLAKFLSPAPRLSNSTRRTGPRTDTTSTTHSVSLLILCFTTPYLPPVKAWQESQAQAQGQPAA